MLQPQGPAHLGSSLGGSDAESGARPVQRVGTDPRKSEVVRTSRFNAEDAEFGQEDTEELSGVLTAYPFFGDPNLARPRRAGSRDGCAARCDQGPCG